MTRIYWIVALIIVAASIAAPAWLYPSLPDRIPTHWNIQGRGRRLRRQGGRYSSSL